MQLNEEENGYDDLPRLITEDDQSDSDSESDSYGDDDDEDDGTPVDAFDEDSVGDNIGTEELPVSSPVVTGSGRVIRKPNNFVPTMTSKSHGNSHSYTRRRSGV